MSTDSCNNISQADFSRIHLCVNFFIVFMSTYVLPLLRGPHSVERSAFGWKIHIQWRCPHSATSGPENTPWTKFIFGLSQRLSVRPSMNLQFAQIQPTITSVSRGLTIFFQSYIISLSNISITRVLSQLLQVYIFCAACYLIGQINDWHLACKRMDESTKWILFT